MTTTHELADLPDAVLARLVEGHPRRVSRLTDPVVIGWEQDFHIDITAEIERRAARKGGRE